MFGLKKEPICTKENHNWVEDPVKTENRNLLFRIEVVSFTIENHKCSNCGVSRYREYQTYAKIPKWNYSKF